MNANSFTANTSLAWMTKKATIIVKIIGIIAKRYRKPKMKPIEHTNSPKIAKPRDMELPSPIGSGKAVDNSWKLLHFCIPWFINNIPKMMRTANKNKDTFVAVSYTHLTLPTN